LIANKGEAIPCHVTGRKKIIIGKEGCYYVCVSGGGRGKEPTKSKRTIETYPLHALNLEARL
jgi:hypothetical protein